jgi:hypothetical protein
VLIPRLEEKAFIIANGKDGCNEFILVSGIIKGLVPGIVPEKPEVKR